MKIKQSLAFIAMLATLTACGDSNVKLVKNYTFDFNKSMNVGTAIDGKPQCKTVQWKDESTKEQKFVSANCTFTDEELKKDFEAETKYFQEVKEKVDKTIQDALQDLEKEYNRMKTESSPEFNREKVIIAAQKVCQNKECDISAFGKEFNLKEKGWRTGIFLEPLAKNYLRKLSQNTDDGKRVCGDWLEECKDEPQMPQSIGYKITFVINTDNSVNVSKGEFLKNGEVTQTLENKYQERGNRAILEPFYERK